MNGKVVRLNDICIFVKDFWGSYEYYTKVFGLKPKRYQPDKENATYVEFEFQDSTVTMWEKSAVIRDAIPAEYLGDETSHNYMVAIKLSTVEEVTKMYKELKERGAKVIKAPVDYEFGTRAVYLQDHENNIWEIFAWFEGDGPGLVK